MLTESCAPGVICLFIFFVRRDNEINTWFIGGEAAGEKTTSMCDR